MFRAAFKERRCIVPAIGFFERTGEKGAKQPYLFTAADGSPLLALCRPMGDRWKDPPHRRMADVLYDHRLGRQRLDRAVLLEVLMADSTVRSVSLARMVSPRLNRTVVGDDDPTLIEPIAH
jgi:hypothetical protein